MPFDEDLARRVRQRLADTDGVTEHSMFGGKAFLLDGNLCVGVIRTDLVARVGPEQFVEAVERPGARPFDLTGRPMSGWVMVAPEGIGREESLTAWVSDSLAYVRTLPRTSVK
jgi:hypothetical protein